MTPWEWKEKRAPKETRRMGRVMREKAYALACSRKMEKKNARRKKRQRAAQHSVANAALRETPKDSAELCQLCRLVRSHYFHLLAP